MSQKFLNFNDSRNVELEGTNKVFVCVCCCYESERMKEREKKDEVEEEYSLYKNHSLQCGEPLSIVVRRVMYRMHIGE